MSERTEPRRLTYSESLEVLDWLKNCALDKFEAVTEADLYDCLSNYQTTREEGKGEVVVVPEVDSFERRALFARANAYAYGEAVANLWETPDADITDACPAKWRADSEERYRRDILEIL